MKSDFLKVFSALLIISAVSTSNLSAASLYDRSDDFDFTGKSSWDTFYESYICNHLEIGIRWGFPKIDHAKKWDGKRDWGFIGTISELQEDIPAIPHNLVINYFFTEWIGMGFAWDSLKATAHTGYTVDRHDDGQFATRGPTLTLVLSVPDVLEGRLVPYAEVGANFPYAEFNAGYWWEYGFSSPGDYKEAGSPTNHKPRNGKHRYIDTREKSKIGLVYGAGAKYFLTQHLCLDFSLRHINADAESHFYYTIGHKIAGDHDPEKVSLDYTVFAAGLRYAF